jgi:hypothetical protein
MPKWSREQVENYYNSLYLLFLDEARQNFSKIGRNLKINDKSAAKLYRWALAEGILLPPFLRLNAYPNHLEYTCFMKFRDAQSTFLKMTQDSRVVYVSHCSGAFDLMVIAREKIDFSMEKGFDGFVLSGPRSDFTYNKVVRRSMGEYYSEFDDFLKKKDFITSKLAFPVREEFTWDDLDLSLFRLLKNDLRMKYVDILRCLGLSKSVFYPHLNNVVDKCTVWTPYYPHGYSNYNGYFILFKTDHEKQLVDKLKGIPVHCPILKVDTWIYTYILLERDFLQNTFFDLLSFMVKSGFIEEYVYSVPISHWNKKWTTQDFPHHSQSRHHHME